MRTRLTATAITLAWRSSVLAGRRRALGYAKLAFLSALALRFSACADRSEVVAPADRSELVAPNAAIRSNVTLGTASVIYSNFGPGMSFDTSLHAAWTINGFVAAGYGQQAIAQQFTPSADYRFSGAEVALELLRGPNIVHLFLHADAAGLPGEVIEEISVGGLASTSSVITASSQHFPLLREGTPYWLSVVAGADYVLAGWNWNTIGDSSREMFASTQGGSPAGPWGLGPSPSKRGAFQIDGIPAVQPLMADVRTLVSEGVLSQDQGNGLLDKLTAADGSLIRGRANAGCNQLSAFVNQVRALINASKLSEATGQELIDTAEGIRATVGCL